VTIGGVTATSQAVEAATSISTQFTQDTDNDGLVGLAFSSINTVQPQAVTTFFDTVSSSLDQALFCADLKKGAAGSYDFGFIDSSKYTGDIVYTSVDSSQGFWMFTADSYSIGSSSSSSNGSGSSSSSGGKHHGKGGSAAKSGGSLSGIADTGTTLMLLDDSVVSAYYAQVKGAKNDATQGGYIFPCSATLPDFSLVIGGETRTGK
jgi:aspergillopepsin I